VHDPDVNFPKESENKMHAYAVWLVMIKLMHQKHIINRQRQTIPSKSKHSWKLCPEVHSKNTVVINYFQMFSILWSYAAEHACQY